MLYPRLKIIHNHGVIQLANATIKDGEAVGTVVHGHSTSRLFHASSTRHEEPGKQISYPVWSRQVRQQHAGGAVNGKCIDSPTPGEFVVDVCSCG